MFERPEQRSQAGLHSTLIAAREQVDQESTQGGHDELADLVELLFRPVRWADGQDRRQVLLGGVTGQSRVTVGVVKRQPAGLVKNTRTGVLVGKGTPDRPDALAERDAGGFHRRSRRCSHSSIAQFDQSLTHQLVNAVEVVEENLVGGASGSRRSPKREVHEPVSREVVAHRLEESPPAALTPRRAGRTAADWNRM